MPCLLDFRVVKEDLRGKDPSMPSMLGGRVNLDNGCVKLRIKVKRGHTHESRGVETLGLTIKMNMLRLSCAGPSTLLASWAWDKIAWGDCCILRLTRSISFSVMGASFPWEGHVEELKAKVIGGVMLGREEGRIEGLSMHVPYNGHIALVSSPIVLLSNLATTKIDSWVNKNGTKHEIIGLLDMWAWKIG